MPWGKYKGLSLYDVTVEYLDWLIGQDWMRNKNNSALARAIHVHLEHSRTAEVAELEREE